MIEATAAETGLPCDDPVRFGGEGLWRDIEAGVDALPWVTLEAPADAPSRSTRPRDLRAHATGRWSCRCATRS